MRSNQKVKNQPDGESGVGGGVSDRWGVTTRNGERSLLIKKGKGSIVPTTLVIGVDAIKIRRIRPATSFSKPLQAEGQAESIRPHPGGLAVSDQRD